MWLTKPPTWYFSTSLMPSSTQWLGRLVFQNLQNVISYLLPAGS
jgi:hypothetical protein